MRVQARGIDEVDVMLLDAMHASPRITFERLGPVLGISPVTAARRWQRLNESGRAWVSSVPGPQLALVGAVYQVRAQPGHIGAVAAALSAIPQVASLYATDGDFDLHALVFADEMRSLSALLLERLPRVPHVAYAKAQVGLGWHSGIHWRLGAIDGTQIQAISGSNAGADADAGTGRRRGSRARTHTFDSDDRALFLALQHDGRAGLRDLARELGSTEHLVRRRIDSLIRRDMLGFRTDFTRGEGGWPTEFVLWLHVPQHTLEAAATEIGGWPQTRICMSVIGPANLMVMPQVHQLTDIGDLLTRINRAVPEAAVTDQRLVLRAFKSWGRLLDEHGRATGVIPVDPWAPVEG